VIDKIKMEGNIDLSFSRDKYINKAFLESYQILISKILLARDLNKIKNIELKKIKGLVDSFQVLEENIQKDKYIAVYKVFYNDKKVKKFLGQKNISFFQPKNISAIFFPVLIINEEIQDFNESFFYKQWKTVEIKNELINFILPLEDLDDVSKIYKMRNKIEELNVGDLVNKYNINNYVFAFMDYKKSKLRIYLKTSFNNNKISKNFLYDIDNIEDESKLKFILKDLKIQITDLWKQENIINLSTPLLIRVKFEHLNLENLDKLKKNLNNISIIENYSLEELNIKNSFFKIYYFGNPRKLRNELQKYGYQLINDQGQWKININE
tara:strand:- start:1309 stop:2280 length:972 start_codon:yes stop_codon:yes gene_type:complete